MGNTCWVIVKDVYKGTYRHETEVIPLAVFLTREEALDHLRAHDGSDAIEVPFGQSVAPSTPKGMKRYQISILQDKDQPKRSVMYQIKEADPPVTWDEFYKTENATFFYRGCQVSEEEANRYGLPGATQVIQRIGHVFAANEKDARHQVWQQYLGMRSE